MTNRAAVTDTRHVVNYFRLSEDNRLLFGGRESYRYRFPRDIKAYVRRAMLRVFPRLKDVRIEYGWGGVVGITMNRMPHFERLRPGLYAMGGYSGHGVAMATMGGKLAADLIAGEGAGFDLMARAPSPAFPGGYGARRATLALGMLYYSLLDRL